MEKRAIRGLFNPSSIAVVGASPRAGSAGNNILQNLADCGFSGAIYPVNPRYDEISGRQAFKSLKDIGESVEAVFIAVAAKFCVEVMQQAAEIGAKAVFLNATGFAEAGAEGMARQEEIASIAQAYGMAVCGPNNLGIVNVVDGVPMWTAHLSSATVGEVAVISQSGSVALALGDDPTSLGLSHVVTTGSEAVCGVADYVDYLADDPRVRTVLLFLETIRDPAALAMAARRARSAGQKILAVKVGRSDMARAAVEAHSGALSGEDSVVDAFFRKHGIQRCVDLDDMVQRAALCQKQPPQADSVAAYVTLSGGQAAAIADYASDVDLNVSGLPEQVAQSLRAEFFDVAPENPMDVWGFGWDAERFARIMETLVDAPEIAPIVFTLDTPASGGVDGPMAIDMANVAAGFSGRKTIIFVGNSAISGMNPELAQICQSNGFPTLLGLPGAMRAIAAWRKGEVVAPSDVALAPEGTLSKAEIEETLRSRLVFVTPLTVDTGKAAVAVAQEVGYPVVLKGNAPGALHKTELGLVRIGLMNDDDVQAGFEDVARILSDNKATLGAGVVQVEPMIAPGIEVLVGARRDPQFGPLVVFGAGGQLVELMADSALRLGTVSDIEAADMIAETRIATLLAGYRGAPPRDVAAVRNAIRAVAEVISLGAADVVSIEINPLIVHPEGLGATVVDLVIE